MELTHRLGFLIVTGSLSAGDSKVAVEPTLAEAVGRWGVATRLSPIYSLGKEQQSAQQSLKTAAAICFLGFASPASLPVLPEGIGLWATLGTFNMVAYADDAERLRDFARQLHSADSLQYELWVLDAQSVVKVEHPPFISTELPSTLRSMADHPGLPADLQTSISEYCALMASSLARTGNALPALREELVQVHEFAVTALGMLNSTPPRTSLYQVMGVFSHLNAGLSRFCAQSLSGVSPIHQTECHFWIHSLLGTGVGNLALHAFTKFVASRMDGMNLPARLRALDGVLPVQDLHKVHADFWHGNHLQNIAAPSASSETPVPLLTYFSGRDGFRSGLNTVSAPLASIASCNSRQWSLMTMTHEISHIVIRTVLAILYPDPTTQSGMEALEEYLVDEKRSYLRQIRAFLLDTVISMQQTAERLATSRETTQWDSNRMALLLDRWHHEVEEIMVHLLDFLYFYGQDTDRYVKAIWTTWGVIPNISNRVTEYVIRTLCASLVRHIRRSKGEETARQEVLRNLRELYGQTPSPYVKQALELLENEHEWPQIRSQVVARKGLVKLVRGYLYWDEAAQAIRGDSALTSDASGHDGYRFKVKQIATEMVDNPLRLVEEYTDSMQANEVASVWLLYLLAFNVRKP